LDKGTGFKNARLQGVHLRLPGHGLNGPTLEIYSYTEMYEKQDLRANRKGFGHLAFEVDDLVFMVQKVCRYGGCLMGEITSKEVPGIGLLNFVYVADPEDNLIELQTWS
jgi:catechol 2,3-dioxygenase-like lactoylglutathione lyase family enzyme